MLPPVRSAAVCLLHPLLALLMSLCLSYCRTCSELAAQQAVARFLLRGQVSPPVVGADVQPATCCWPVSSRVECRVKLMKTESSKLSGQRRAQAVVG